LFFTAIVLLHGSGGPAALDYVPLIGASGAVLGLLAGCAVLFPHMAIFGVIPIRIFAVIFALLYFLNMLDSRSGSRLSDACHFGGMVAAVAWLYYLKSGTAWVERKRAKSRQGLWQKKVNMRQAQQAEVDRILDKVHKQGIASLTRREKRTLAEATEQQRREDNRIHRL